MAIVVAVPAAAQQDELGPLQPPPALAPDALTQARAAAGRGDPAEALSRYLRVLASRPDDVAALAGAGQAALDVGDVNAAAGFFARAEARDPRNGRVKAGLALTLLQQGNARGALRLFHDAVDLGVPVASIAADRGLAYDLRGDPKHAQADYMLALHARPDKEVTLRLALSQAIAGDRVAALATLDPLLRTQDVPAWRARAFVYALTGDPADALSTAALVMPRDQVDALAPYLPRLAALRPGDKAAAIHLGRFPGEATTPTQTASITSSRSLVPDGSAIAGVDPFAPPAIVPSGSPAQDQRARERALADALADARARAAARARVPAAIRARGDRLMPLGIQTAQAIPVPASPLTVDPTTPVSEPHPTIAPEPHPTIAELRRQKQQQDRAAKAEADKRDKAEAAKKAALEEKKAAIEEKKARLRTPARHWVQVAGGANKDTLGRAWGDLKQKWPKQLAGRSPWTLHYRFTNRLLIGPFASTDAAQDWVTERRKEGFSTFRVETNAGDPVERVSSD